jgi:hypothetical protein
MDDLGESVWCLVDIKVGSANTDVCDCKKSENKLAILTNNEIMSINQPNYKAPEKSRATKELANYFNDTVNM